MAMSALLMPVMEEVNSADTKAELKNHPNRHLAIFCVLLSAGNKPTTRAVHILVAEAFQGPGRKEWWSRRPCWPGLAAIWNIGYQTARENNMDKHRDGTCKRW